jgi:amino acid transporter
MAIPNMHAAITGNGGFGFGPAQIIEANFSPAFATIYLLVVTAAIFVCCLSIMAATIRLCFGMSRDNQLPLSGALSKVSPSLHTPICSCIAIAVLAAIPFIQFSGAGTIAIAATAMIYFAYFLGNIAILLARLRGWPKTPAPFKLGRWGMAVNIVGLLYGGAMLVNFAWPRIQSNPSPNQSGVLNFHIGFLNKIPILWTVFVVIAVIGLIYYQAVGRTKDFAPIRTPEADDAPLVG